MTEFLIALGANLPQNGAAPAQTLTHALARIAAHGPVQVVRQSAWYRTPAVPPGSGPDFVNGAAMLAVDGLEAADMLALLHRVEAALGRRRPMRWAPRTCDLDLLAMGEAVLPDLDTARRWMALGDSAAGAEAPEALILPHPRLHLRAFVLVPLAEIAPDWRHPVLGQRAADLRDRLPATDLAAVRPL